MDHRSQPPFVFILHDIIISVMSSCVVVCTMALSLLIQTNVCCPCSLQYCLLPIAFSVIAIVFAFYPFNATQYRMQVQYRIYQIGTIYSQSLTSSHKYRISFGHQSGLYERSRRNSTNSLDAIAFRVYLVFSKIGTNTDFVNINKNSPSWKRHTFFPTT